MIINRNSKDILAKSIEIFTDPDGNVRIELYGNRQDMYYCNLLREAVTLFRTSDDDMRGGYDNFPELDHN
jgi:hypothetical protein